MNEYEEYDLWQEEERQRQEDYIDTQDLPSYIPGYEELCEEQEQEIDYDAYDEYIDMLINEQILERLEKEENEQERTETI